MALHAMNAEMGKALADISDRAERPLAAPAARAHNRGMIAAKRIRGTFGGVLAGLLLTAVWGALVGCGVTHFTRFGAGLSFESQLRWGAEIGAIGGVSLFLFYQPPLGRPFFALFDRIPFTSVVLFPLLVAYHLGAFPGVLVGRLLGVVTWAGKPGPKPAVSAPGLSATEPCPFEGRVVAQGPIVFRNVMWSAQEAIFEIHEDWRVSSEKIRYWGWIDAAGNVHEGTGDPTSGAGGDARVVAGLRRTRAGFTCFAADEPIGVLRKV